MPIIRKNPECISCIIKKHVDQYPESISREDKIKYMERVLLAVANSDIEESAPQIVEKVYQIQREMFGSVKNLSHVKSYFNQKMLGYENKIKNNIEKSQNPLLCALKYAMIGNFIDFGAMATVDEDKLISLIDSCEEQSIDEDAFESLKNNLENAKRLVYLTDNCGEIVFDKAFISEIQNQFPSLSVTAIVRGGEVLNDCTLYDAHEVGLDKICHVIDNGTLYAGTCLDEISEDAKDAIDNADLIIAKGQGNLETLQYCGLNIFYAFMCKCRMFSNKFGKPLYSGVLINDRDLPVA